ncbi:hypothetical protein BCU90_17395 [Vibrio lentus]|uniref:hypothetical protein n=1 Tax=Vibrio lentus TaxID=136468 RepID=UPI000C81655A|nr:hypothetical protein [Vibrio lentus]PMG45639.1 hypothetical protein BCU90_17395 [Vibrio lentus]
MGWGSSNNTEVHNPAYDDNMQGWLDDISGSLGGWNPTLPDRESSDGVLGAIGGANNTLDQIMGEIGGLTPDGIMSDAAGYINPEMVQGMIDSNQQVLGQAFAGIDSAATGGGNMGSSRAGLAQGSAATGASQSLNNQLLDYGNQQIDRAYQNRMGQINAASGMLGAGIDLAQLQREIQQGDSNASWMGDLISSNPDILRALIYGGVANTSPIGSVTQG